MLGRSSRSCRRWIVGNIEKVANVGGRDSFHFRMIDNSALSRSHDSAQLGNSDAISFGQEYIYFGVGRIL